MHNNTSKPVCCILGAGVVGTSAAVALAKTRPGHDIVLVERNHELADFEASFVNCGLVLPMHLPPHPFAQLERHSMSFYADLATRYPEIAMEMNKPTLIACTTTEELDHAHALARESEGTMEVLLPVDAAKLEPAILLPHSSSSKTPSSTAYSSAIGWLHVPACASADPALTTRALVREAVTLGVRVIHSCIAYQVEHLENGQMRIVFRYAPSSSDDTCENRTGRDVHAKEFVLIVDQVAICCGWRSNQVARDLFGASVPVFPVTGQMWMVNPKSTQQHDAEPLILRANILSMESQMAWAKPQLNEHSSERVSTTRPQLSHLTHTMHTVADERKRITRHLYFRQKPSGELVCGGDRIFGCEVPLEAARSHANRAQLEEVLPFVRDCGEIERMWVGVMPWTVDMMPILGRLPGCGTANVFVATGLASHGFSMGPGLGDALMNCMNDLPHELCNASRVCAAAAHL
jgi:glycine/D-amino acid oxidase-like deaminating enzyme